MARSQRVSKLRLRQGLLSWLLSCYYRAKRDRDSGFVLPTATLLILVAFLIMISLLARTANRVIQVSGQRERITIEGPTAESIDRARAKLEYLFTQERLPSDPSEQNYEDALGHRRRNSAGAVVGPRAVNDIYTLPDEFRCGSQTGDCVTSPVAFTPDNIAPTWAYRVDLNGNGRVDDPNDGVAVYSIIGRVIRGANAAVPVLNPDGTPNPSYTHLTDRRLRAANFLINNAPAQAERADAFCAGASGSVDERGRFSSGSSATELKNFQIYAVTMPNRIGQEPQLTVNAMVFQQDRQFVGANKWGAWFRYDLEIFPGPQFNWNGAMHTEGTLLLTSGTGFSSFLISAPNSCYFLPAVNSEISARGLFMSGSNRDNNNSPGGNTLIHLQPVGRQAPTHIMQVTTSGAHTNPTVPGTYTSPDAVRDGFLPVDISMDPLYLITDNLPVARRRDGGSESYETYKDNNWGGGLAQRIQIDKCEAPPYVDDTYRADNRLGPKPSYARGSCEGAAKWAGSAGDLITGTVTTDDPQTTHTLDALTRNAAPPDQPDEYGLDGYWERRALGQGMKVIVGQRLELGNVGVWGGWRVFGRHNNGYNWTAGMDWRSWTASPSQPGVIYNSESNSYFRNAATNTESREIFGLLFRTNSPIAGIPSPGAADPLYPPAVLATEFAAVTSPYNFAVAQSFSTDRLNWQLHRRTQRDNLAAVQASAVYHRANPGPSLNESLPLLCLSSTIHPGTEASYLNSITYGDPVSPADPAAMGGVTRYPRLNANFVRPPGTVPAFPPADFFTGRGTANMEYGSGDDATQPPFTVDDFDTGSVLRKALANLAYFAGDPNGAFPPLQAPPGNRQVYPDPVLTMWGNFSNLRRTIGMLEDEGFSYEELSPADQANLHTAGCTLSLLATNVHHYLDFPFYRNDSSGGRPYDNTPDLSTPEGLRINIQRLAHELYRLQDGIDNPAARNYEIGRDILDFTAIGNNVGVGNPERYNIPAEYYIAALARIRDTHPFSRDPNSDYQRWNRLVYLARFINTRLQIVRDRTYGFREYLPGQWLGIPTVESNTGSGQDSFTGIMRANNQRLAYRFRTVKTHVGDPYGSVLPVDLGSSTLNPAVNLPCDVSLADIDYFGYSRLKSPISLADATNPDIQRIEREMVALARLCPTQPKYPSLYYLFPGDLNSDGIVGPGDQHGHDGTSGINRRNSDDPSPYNQPSGSASNSNERFSEPYVLSRYITEEANALVTYEPLSVTDLRAMRLSPRTNPDDWELPILSLLNNRPVTDANLYQRETDLIVSVEGATAPSLSAYRTGLAEKALFNGRELQTTRVMDFDLDLLRRVDLGPRGSGDAWLSVGELPTPTTPARAGGIIYAFREDAVREDAILRPANSTWGAYLAQWRTNFQDGPGVPFRMNYDPRNPSDPPVVESEEGFASGISGKPVDYYADPDRRAHGFRLMNGNDISRVGVPPERNIYGLTFVSDNPVYIMTQLARGRSGFNLHADAGGNPIEEFTTALPFPYTFNQFYVSRTTRNLLFATPAGDTWRPAEILADAITLITHNFCDGYLEHGIRNVTNIDGLFGDECTSGGPSFRNTLAITNPNPLPARNGWAREYPYDLGAPIIVASDGTHRLLSGTSTQTPVGVDNYQAISTRAAVPGRGTDYTVNAVIISGLVPSRRGQAYGGLHNFPRFLETGNALNIQGSLIQLNFSNYATSPFDHDSFERQQVGQPVTELIPYYGPPSRFWGYDPALQYAPAGPVAQRFKILSNARNEYALELSAQDPYTCQLQRFIIPGLACP